MKIASVYREATNFSPCVFQVRDSERPVGVLVERIGSYWVPTAALHSDGSEGLLPSCFSLNTESRAALDNLIQKS